MTKKSNNKILQICIPKILANEFYIDKLIAMIAIRYKFKVDRANLRKKLNIFYTNSFYIKNKQLSQGQRLIKGSYINSDEGNYIWVSSCQIVYMVKSLRIQLDNTKGINDENRHNKENIFEVIQKFIKYSISIH